MKKHSAFSSALRRIKDEIRVIDLRMAALFALIVLILGLFSRLTGRNSMCIAPGYPPGLGGSFFSVFWTLSFLVLGAVLGAILASPRCAHRDYHKNAVLYFVLMIVFHLIWYPLCFASAAYFLALIDLVIMMVFGILAMINMARVYLLCTVVTGVHLLWLLYCFYLNLLCLIVC